MQHVRVASQEVLLTEDPDGGPVLSLLRGLGRREFVSSSKTRTQSYLPDPVKITVRPAVRSVLAKARTPIEMRVRRSYVDREGKYEHLILLRFACLIVQN